MRMLRSATLFLLATTATLLSGQQAKADNYESMLAELTQLHADNPELTSWITLGENDHGDTIKGLKIEASGGDFKANHLVVGVHHGNEQLSAEVALEFARQTIELMANTNLPRAGYVSDRIFHVFPVLNIPGFNRNRREETDGNGRSHDPNRDYPDPCDGGERTYKLKSTAALANYTVQQDIVGAVTIHGYIGTFTYPWGTYTSQTRTLDDNFFFDVTRAAATVNGYRVGTHADVIYPTVGAYEDWAYYMHGVWVTLLEIHRSPDIEADAESLIAYFAQLPAVRSVNHEHTGSCLQPLGPILARP